ncbi:MULTISPECIES: ABC transporter permease [unclassified Paenibacillus]|uniref:ABC transporter permease n=1 Tax=unclassified Paenibacillus TaxID=185978 RepID=UPI0024066AF8|nr:MULTISPECIES: ABC transporter permease [unclassified Paenibacillus]MDF9841742.1 ribose transport system permease protein [Paenibacillus sp. PastF-2]MDF9848146.1 ribose transport system permease protein [Paenibacillus sp. PastM-2]MDF9854901.1 ribose transport system permease protein [Paenibacillus sp. PastF-1]MDH6480171.1 ribose transport system permease protein [Paenibacillus sp. PastH-2]MDH6507601.1 ribose transport system permease protein [Paenibacillus sp. PastM-3]
MANQSPEPLVQSHSDESKELRLPLRFDRQVIGLILFLAVIIIGMSFASEHFLSYNNLLNVLQQSAFVMILAFGMTFVLSTGGIDLSVGSIVGISGGMTAWLLYNDVNIVLAIIGGMIVGTAIGIINGLVITKLGISPFIATLAMMIMARGVLYVWTRAIPFREYMKSNFDFLGQGRILGIQFPVILAAVLLLILLFVFRRMKFGRHVLALGSSEEAVRISGIKVDRLRIKVYALSGLIAAIAGILLASRLTTVHPEMGKNYELEAIAAAIIGGTSLTGGKGSLVGTALGAIILFMIKNAMNLLNVHPYWETIVVGVIILVAVSINNWGGISKPRLFTRKSLKEVKQELT